MKNNKESYLSEEAIIAQQIRNKHPDNPDYVNMYIIGYMLGWNGVRKMTPKMRSQVRQDHPTILR